MAEAREEMKTKGLVGFIEEQVKNQPEEPLTEKAFDEFLEIAFQITPNTPKWLAIRCPFCEELVGVGQLPEGAPVSKCEHELRLVKPIREFAEKKQEGT